ncbi:ABC transporter ATP-binding protein [Pseudonocardia eucalypti]|uniref:ABC transporter ATP-binding protein n=1 Tax=Pseudonocardia eucalypti TaxID=648755 RepID=A0ABP9QVI5_9PSEU|nr:peptide/nickel transport system ATP-binding protein [Pseudonocardia eucalypti]
MSLRVDRLSVRFWLGPRGSIDSGEVVSAVSDVSFTLRPGRLLALVGESGCGKSVLTSTLVGLLPANADVRGEVWWSAGAERVELLGAPEPVLRDRIRGRAIGLVPQSAATHLTPVRTLGGQLREAARVLRPSSDPGAAALAAIAQVGLDEAALEKYPHELSGGMAQRAGVAMALVGGPEVILADEPTAGLDRELVEQTMDLLAGLARAGHAVLVVTHDLRAVRRVADDLAVMYASRLVETGPAGALFDRPWHPYTRGLLGALPDGGFRPIPGDPPELTRLPDGCAFRPRCPVSEDCTGDSELRAHGDRAVACHPAPA